MSTAHLAIAFIHPHTKLPFYIFGNDNIKTIERLHKVAQHHVPKDVHYEIIPVTDAPQEAVPVLTDTPASESDLSMYFKHYLSSLE
jgi:hypothetical protein